ncbi:MAG: LptF/LptG family permease [Cystobacterineae bacterium]|nr:LptF/LptG family permease [Cystobacterineae bacterium]
MRVGKVLFRYIALRYLQMLLFIWLGLVVIFLVVDFGDQLKMYLARPIGDVLLMYWNKFLLCLSQMCPIAMLLAGGSSIAALAHRSEVKAMLALGASPWVFYAPVGLCALGVAIGLCIFDEKVATHAGHMTDELQVYRFKRYGNVGAYFIPKQWFHIGDTMFYMNSPEEGGFRDISIFRLSPSFQMTERIDAETMKHDTGEFWQLTDVRFRRFLEGGKMETQTKPVALLRFPKSSADSFRILSGRPEWMRLKTLWTQRQLRAQVGLATPALSLALHNRFATPLMGVLGALLTVALTQRPGRKGQLTLALTEGVLVSVLLWGSMVIGRALVLGERTWPWLAAWGPVLFLTVLTWGLGHYYAHGGSFSGRGGRLEALLGRRPLG